MSSGLWSGRISSGVVGLEPDPNLFSAHSGSSPQAFARDVLERALRKARQDGFYGTDEAALVERTGHPVAVVLGDRRNIKITTAADLKMAEALLED